MGGCNVNKPRYLPWVFLTESAGVLSGIFSRKGIELFASAAEKPSISPPPILFPVVWTILYFLMGISAARIASFPDGRQRSLALNLFIIQLIVNFFWSLIFFNARIYGLALLWLILLWMLILAMILFFYKLDRPAAMLQIPYLLWVSFAAYLSYMVWLLNL